ncbi:transmembrane protein 87A isoform X1 [Planococcus citri]|uniref:transmembrane protein 87A isoform X1 n=1 Tax=Planococcus citri TaxID=170843 RepID=UPI0031F88A6B
MFHVLFSVLLFSTFFSSAFLLSDKAKWDFNISQDLNFIRTARSLFKGSEIIVQIFCKPKTNASTSINVAWALSETICWEDYLNLANPSSLSDLQAMYLTENRKNGDKYYIRPEPQTLPCTDKIVLKEYKFPSPEMNNGKLPEEPSKSMPKKSGGYRTPIYTITKDGLYLLTLNISFVDSKPFEAKVHIEMKGTYGYLSAAEWPLLPFYATMCVVYVFFSLVWLTVSFMQWRDLLRIQFWIGAVILIGMVEKALFFEEYNSVNETGESSLPGTIFVAELVSAAKRTLARMLVIIVSLGYGIVKPRLGSHLPRVLGVGIVFFILAAAESYPRVMRPPNDSSTLLILASIPLALLDSFICWWIFANLVQTTRTLRLRRNLVKLTLYNHFTNTLIFSVVASTIFMLYSIKAHRAAFCLTDWKELWVDDAYWHLLFSIILLVIMILWRPTNNNQRYAFSPLLDAPEDDDDDEEIEHFVNDGYGVKMRGTNMMRNESPKPKSVTNEDEDLKWVEENIPPCLIDTTFPILDTDEESMELKFELSKME